MVLPATRRCLTCADEKPLTTEFYKQKNGKHGRNAHCRSCCSKAQQARLRTPEGKAKYTQYARNHRSKPGYAAKHKTYRDCPKGKWNAYRKDAERRDHVFQFTLERFTQLFWQKPCFYCGEVNATAGVDRLDNGLGYTEDNAVPCCYTCNIMKRTASAPEFIKKCRQIVANLPA